MWKEREERERARHDEIEGAQSEVDDLQKQMDSKNDEIEWLLELNRDPDIAAADKEKNIQDISTFREEFFALMDQKDVKQ